jgi:hypothetical protein
MGKVSGASFICPRPYRQTEVRLEAEEYRMESVSERERAMPNNRNLIIIIAVVVAVAIIYYLYTTGRLSGII